MANDIITNLHPDNDSNTNLYPNIKKQNIPSKSISTDKLDDNVLSLIGSLKPAGTDTSTNILAYTSNKGIYVATDNGHWYYWNGTQYVDGGQYITDSSYDELKEDISNGNVGAGTIIPYKTSFMTTGLNKFNKDRAEVGYYYAYNSGNKGIDSNYTTSEFIKVNVGELYWINKLAHIVCWNANKEYVSGFVNPNNSAYSFTIPDNTEFITISITNNQVNNCMLSRTDTYVLFEPYYETLKSTTKYLDYSKYQFAYIKDNKLCCNKVYDSRTAIYSGVDCGGTPNKLKCKMIFERSDIGKQYVGEIAIITNPNGLTRVTDITSKSLHLEVYPSGLTLSLFDKNLEGGRIVGIYQKFSTGLICDGVTEHTVEMSWNDTTVTCKINDYIYTYTYQEGTGSLSDYIGRYCTIEHYVAQDRDLSIMPMFTYFEVAGTNIRRVRDWFKREDGALYTTPTGQPYVQISNMYYDNDNN